MTSCQLLVIKLQSPGSSASKKVSKKRVPSSENTTNAASKPASSSTDNPAKSVSDRRSAMSSADARIDEVDQKWLDRLNRLEALLLARTLEKPEPTFKTVKVAPTHSPSSVRGDRTLHQDRPQQQVTGKSTAPARGQSASSMDTDCDSDMLDQPEVSIFVEEGELSDQDPDVTVIDTDQTLSEEQTYRETMRGIRYMGWSHIPDMETTTSSEEDIPVIVSPTRSGDTMDSSSLSSTPSSASAEISC